MTMRKTTMHKLLSAIALASSALGFSFAANAADLSRPPPPVYKAPAVVAPPFSWTGFYIGGNVGAGWSRGSWTDSLFGLNWNPNNNAVFIGGGQVGANYQIQNFVVGLEADFDWAANNNNSSNSVTVITGAGPQTFQLSANNRWITTVAARVGYAWDRVLVYAKGGGGWVGNGNFTLLNVGTGATFTASNSNTNAGWLVGGGVEWAFAQNWTVRAEYDFLGLNNRSFTVPAGFPVLAGDTFSSNNRNVQMATVGINYLFNWGGF